MPSLRTRATGYIQKVDMCEGQEVSFMQDSGTFFVDYRTGERKVSDCTFCRGNNMDMPCAYPEIRGCKKIQEEISSLQERIISLKAACSIEEYDTADYITHVHKANDELRAKVENEELKKDSAFFCSRDELIRADNKREAAEQERNSWKTQWVECCENLNIVAKERDRMKQAIERALADSESGEGKWGPDVTICLYLQEAIKEA